MKEEKYLTMNQLSARIYCFLEKYACTKPDYDKKINDEEDKFTSPDASELKCCADLLSMGVIPKRCWSEWGSGGYKPYASKEGRDEHDFLLTEIQKIINLKYH